MHCRFMLIAALVASVAAPAIADPGKIAAQQASQPTERPAPILLAQVDIRAPQQADVQASPADSQAPAPAKRPRASRVTTCRCAGQTPQQP